MCNELLQYKNLSTSHYQHFHDRYRFFLQNNIYLRLSRLNDYNQIYDVIKESKIETRNFNIFTRVQTSKDNTPHLL